MAKHRMKLDLNNLMSLIDDTLSAEEIETVHNNAYGISIGLELLYGYLREIGQRAIDTNDEFLQKWCLNLHILKEDDDG